MKSADAPRHPTAAPAVTENRKPWTASSWRDYPIRQQPDYADKAALTRVETELSRMPPMVAANEIRKLKKELAKAAEGKAFVLQGGDCAESFAEFHHDNLKNYFQILLQMTVALMYGAGVPVVKLGRVAGQFAKPRSAATEMIDGVEYASYRGDMVNAMDLDHAARQPDPERLLQAYHQSTATLNYLRSLAKGGHASLHRIAKWNTDFIRRSPQAQRFKRLTDEIASCLTFIEACGLKMNDISQLKEADFYTSHEALLLNYEEAFTRRDETTGKWYSQSAHMLWIGDRTRGLEDAHVEYMRGIGNPVGVKVGPSMKEDELIQLIDLLNPENEAGRLVLISRMGKDAIQEHLPRLVRRVKQEGRSVVWSSDPMHGNTFKSPNGIKTRRFNDILAELRHFFAIHKTEGTFAGGVHFEMTGQDVTECLGGAQAISEVDLHERYHTHCDPRMNASQSLEMAFLIAEELQAQHRRETHVVAMDD